MKLRRILATLAIGAVLVLAAPAMPASAAQVFCRVPTNHQVVCFNYTQYRVHMSLVVRTSAGTRYFDFWNNYTVWRHFFAPIVYHISWRWHY